MHCLYANREESMPHRPFLCHLRCDCECKIKTHLVDCMMVYGMVYLTVIFDACGCVRWLTVTASWTRHSCTDAGRTVSRLIAVFAVGYRGSSHCYSCVKKKTPPAHSPQFPFTILTTPPPINTPPPLPFAQQML